MALYANLSHPTLHLQDLLTNRRRYRKAYPAIILNHQKRIYLKDYQQSFPHRKATLKTKKANNNNNNNNNNIKILKMYLEKEEQVGLADGNTTGGPKSEPRRRVPFTRIAASTRTSSVLLFLLKVSRSPFPRSQNFNFDSTENQIARGTSKPRSRLQVHVPG